MLEGSYERDVLIWAEQQADLLRRLAAGERLNAAVDWPRVIEEVQDVGLSELRACQSLLQQAIMHLLELHAWPASQAAAHWSEEAGVFLDDAGRRFTPSMRARIALDDLYAKALRRVLATAADTGIAGALPETCPFALDDLLAGDVAELVTTLGTAA